MIRRTLAEIATLAGGRLVDGADGGTLVTGPIVADSHRVEPGGLFVAVAGERVDGHDFADAAMAAGAVAVLAARPVGVPAVLVDDPVTALGRVAHGYLAQLRSTGNPLVVSITGSSGKTSTKDLLAQVLQTAGPTVAPEGSFNTEVGLPLTVLRAAPDTRYLVLEASSRGIGHLAYLCAVARPDIAVVLNVGAAHLGEFGSRETVAKAKGELVESLADDGLAVLNADDARVLAMTSRTTATVVTFGRSDGADVRATGVALDERAHASFTLTAHGESVPVALSSPGAHQVSNALAVAAVALRAGLALPDIAAAISKARPVSRWRMETTTRRDGVVVVNDAYNANPDSMRAALQALAAMATGPGGRRWAVLGPMAELGTESAAAHRELGGAVATTRIDRLVVIAGGSAGANSGGNDAAAIAEGARSAALTGPLVSVVGSLDEAVAVLAELGPGDVVLVKASRSAGLERIAAALLPASQLQVRA